MRCALLFLFALASASALAFASAAFFAFSRSTSESSAASHDSRTCARGQYGYLLCMAGQKLCMAGYGGLTHIAILFFVVELAAAGDRLGYWR
jgi:uncharacterized membrane protein